MDKKLLKACVKRDERACMELFKALYSLLMGISMRYQKNEDDAKEVVQTTFMKVLNSLEKITWEQPIEGWARQICINTNIDHLRAQKKYRETIQYPEDLAQIKGTQPAAYEHEWEGLSYEDILSMVRTLPETSAQVFNLYVIDGYKHREIAEILKITEGTSRWHLSYSRSLLQEKINKAIKLTKISTDGK